MKLNKLLDRSEISEHLLAIANVAHAEYHAVETAMLNPDQEQQLYFTIKLARDIRRELMEILRESFPAMTGIWCIVKHLLLTEFHLYELYEKQYDKRFLKLALDIHLNIDELLVTDDFKNLKACPRCNEEMNNEYKSN